MGFAGTGGGNQVGGGKRVGGMQLYRLRRGMVLNRAVRRAVARAEEPQCSAWEKQVSAGLKRRLGPDRMRCRSGRAIGKIWDSELATVAASGIGATGNVRRVARTLGIGQQTLYRHRKEDPAFQVDWETQLAARYNRLELAVLDRLTDGWEEDVWYCGEQVGVRRRFDHSGAVALLRLRRQTEKEMAERSERAAARAVEAGFTASASDDGKMPECDANGARYYDHRERDLLLIQLMERHRNRHPEEWEGDEHKDSGFDLASVYETVYGPRYRTDD